MGTARTVTTATIEASLTRSALTGDIYDDSSTLNVATIKHIYSGLSLILTGHLNEAEASLTTRCGIKNYSS
jgi:hypothetical protein